MLEAIPKLNHDILVELSLYLAYDAQVNDKDIWRRIEDAAFASLHQMSLIQICQMEWASMELKPKQIRNRLNTMLMNKALENVDKCNLYELMCIMQGFRSKKSKDLYSRIRKTLIARKG